MSFNSSHKASKLCNFNYNKILSIIQVVTLKCCEINKEKIHLLRLHVFWNTRDELFCSSICWWHSVDTFVWINELLRLFVFFFLGGGTRKNKRAQEKTNKQTVEVIEQSSQNANLFPDPHNCFFSLCRERQQPSRPWHETPSTYQSAP